MKFNLMNFANKFAIAQRSDESDKDFILRLKQHSKGVVAVMHTGFRIHTCKHCVQMVNEHDTTCTHCGEGQ